MQKCAGFAWQSTPAAPTSKILAGTPAPGCTVTVFNAGTTNPATIFADNVGTPLTSTFNADANAYWAFYAANGRYDVQFSGAGIATPYTLSDFLLADP